MNAADVLSLLLAVPAVASIFYFLAASALLHRWMKERPATGADDADLPPVTFFRPLKAGVPNLDAKLAAIADALLPGDQLLIGADAGSAEMAAGEAVRRACPEREITVIECRRGEAKNPKIAKLMAMERHARHEHWILSDSEVMTEADLVVAFRREWRQCDVLTCGYRFSGVSSWPQRLDCAAVLLTHWPGLAVLRASDAVRLTLGAWTGFRRRDLQTIGGWAAFADELAEDQRFGRTLAAAGRTIRLSTQVVTLQCDVLSWRDYWRHQRRVAVTYRMASPAGFAGAIFTQGVTTSLLLACWRPTELWTWLLCGAVFLVRGLTARQAARVVGFSIPSFVPALFLASLVETACWALSWGTRHVWWGGIRRRISRSGLLLPTEPS